MSCSLHKDLLAGPGPSCGRPYALSSPNLLSIVRSQRVRGDACVSCAVEGPSTSLIATSTAEASSIKGSTIKVKVIPPREASQPPTPPSLIHSPLYVQKALKNPSANSAPVATASVSRAGRTNANDEKDQGDDNSLVWALKQVDRSLDELEANPLPLQREIYELSRSPVGTATSTALSTAARVTVTATKEAVRAAVPLGQWVFREGTKAAVSLVSRAMAESAKQQQAQNTAGAPGSAMAPGKGAGDRKQQRK